MKPSKPPANPAPAAPSPAPAAATPAPIDRRLTVRTGVRAGPYSYL
jgi:hypothetical protein